MRISIMPAGNGGVAFYRLLQPYRYLQEKGLADVFIYDSKKHSGQRLMHEQVNADILVFQMTFSEKINEIIELSKKKINGKVKKVVMEYDDNIFGISPYNPVYKTYGIDEIDITYEDPNTKMIDDAINQAPWRKCSTNPNGSVTLHLWKKGHNGFDPEENARRLEQSMISIRHADLVTTTTMELGTRFKRYRGDKPLLVLPNVVDERRWLPMEKKDDGFIRIGWQGGDAHFNDLAMVEKPLTQLLDKYPNLRITMCGSNFQGLFLNHRDRIEFLPWHSDIHTYPLFIKKMSADIGICPLVDDPFNRCKSNLKWLEYSIMGIPSVVSNVVYGKDIKHGKTGFIANNKDQWFSYLNELIENKELRESVGSKARDRVIRNFNINQCEQLYLALSDLVKGVI